VTVTGSINDANSYKGGFKFTMSDSTGQITLLLNDSVYKGIAKLSGLRPGAKVQANGKVDVFNGVLEIVPLDSSKVTVLTAGTGPNLANRAIKTLGNADLNQTIAVEGTITEVKAGASNTRLTVDDGTGKITVLIWPDVLAYVPNSGGLVTGAHVRAIGLVDSYKGSLEVVPQLGFYVTVK
jgi:DNA/RNA endonuclease YhcR with UshA esterase domain